MNQTRIRPVVENSVFRPLTLVDAPDEYVENTAEIVLVMVIRLLIPQILVQCQGV